MLGLQRVHHSTSWFGRHGWRTGPRGLLVGLRSRLARLRPRRVPVLLQLSAFECGAACLAMVLSYHGRKTRVADLPEFIGLGRDGLSAWAIAEAARACGLRVKAFSLEPAQLNAVPLPAIVHWGFNHFVVVERWSPRAIEIVDPAVGRRRLTADEFDAGFTGVVLVLEPGAQLERRRTARRRPWSTFLRCLSSAPGVPGVLAQVIGASVCLQVLGLSLPLFTGLLVDRVLPAPDGDVMTILGLGIVALVLAQLVGGYLRVALLVYLQASLDSRLMLGFFERVLSLPLLFFQQRTSGDLLMRLGSSTNIREMLTNQTLASVLDSGLVLGYLAILLVWDPYFGLVTLGIGALQVALMLGTSRRMQGLVGSELVAQAQSQSYLIEALKGIAALKASGAEQRALDHWSRLYARQLRVAVQRSHLAGTVETVSTTLRTFSPLVLLWIGALRVLDGGLSLGTMLALNALAAAFFAPLASIVASGQQLQLAGAHLDRLADVLEAEPEQDSRSARPAPRLSGRIALKQVSFRYSPNAPYVLHDVSIEIEPGQKVALVGRSGSGKSTLAMLLLGLYLPTSGEVLYDGQPLQSLNLRALRSQLGVVLQDPQLFSASIRENVAFGDASLPLDEVEQAARLAAIHDEITQMGMGYETLLAEGGAGLSGGQRQRLSIARALARQPAILLLDEATSHLDVVTERVLDQQLSSLHSTRIVIAHRLSTVRNADLIVVVEDGAVVEQGTHQELLARGGHYAALLSGQMGTARSEQDRSCRAT